jgi:hypothetical protein
MCGCWYSRVHALTAHVQHGVLSNMCSTVRARQYASSNAGLRQQTVWLNQMRTAPLKRGDNTSCCMTASVHCLTIQQQSP